MFSCDAIHLRTSFIVYGQVLVVTATPCECNTYHGRWEWGDGDNAVYGHVTWQSGRCRQITQRCYRVHLSVCGRPATRSFDWSLTASPLGGERGNGKGEIGPAPISSSRSVPARFARTWSAGRSFAAVFLPRDALLALYIYTECFMLCVCLSVELLQAVTYTVKVYGPS